jgi:hypothetical protein
MDDRLDAALRELADGIVFPPTPDLRASVAARLRAPARSPWWTPAAWPRAMALAVIVTLLVAATATALVIVVPGLRLILVPALPTPDVAAEPLATRLALGEPIAPDTVSAGVPAALGRPDEAYVAGDHEVLSLVYAAGDGLPELAGSEIGLLVQVIDGALDRDRVEKLVVEAGTTITSVQVDGAAGYWIEGPPHLIRYVGASGTDRSQRSRLVGDSLVWESGGALYRIESALGLAETLRIAESISP